MYCKNPTIAENLNRVKSSLSIRDFLIMQGFTFKGNRTTCPYCNKPNFTLMNNDSRYNCYNCSSRGDILDLASYIYSLPPKYTINKLLELTGAKRYTGVFNIKSQQEQEQEKKELDFINKSKEALTTKKDKLDGLVMLNYELVKSYNNIVVDDIYNLLYKVDEKLEQLKQFKYNKEELRQLYKYLIYYINLINDLKNKYKEEINEL